MFVTSYLINLAKRAATGTDVHTAEIVNLPQLIDRTYGDGDGVFEFSDAADALPKSEASCLTKQNMY